MSRSRWAFYLAVFLFSIPLFLWTRWQPEPLLISIINKPKVHKILRIGSVHKHWLPGLRVEGVSIRLHKGPPIDLDYLDVRPVWWRLVTGTPAVKFCGQGKHKSFCLIAVMSGQEIRFSDIDINADTAALKPYLPQLVLFPVKGLIHIQGSLGMLRKSRVPKQADLHLFVNKATLKSGKTPQSIGDYELVILSKDSAWKWSLNGGNALTLHGNGTLKSTGPDVTKWLIQGQIDVTGKGQSALLLKNIAGSDRTKAKISGILRRPVFQWNR